MSSKKIRQPKKQLCIGDRRHKIRIFEREQKGITYGELEGSQIDTTVAEPFAAVTTVRGTQRFSGINVNEAATHLFNVIYTIIVADLDGDNYFVGFKGRNYRILEVNNIDEDNQSVILQATERGDDAKKASKV